MLAEPPVRPRKRTSKGASATSALSSPPAPPSLRAQGKYELLAYARHERDLALSLAPGGHPSGFYFDEAAADRVVTFVDHFCRHHQGKWAGELLVLEPWQKFVLRTAFGWMRANGTRRFRVSYLEIARKNGKTLLAAAIAAYLLIADGEQGAQVYATATKEDQAKLSWTDTMNMVRQSPDLARYVEVMQKSLVVKRTGSFFKPLGGDSKTLDGLNPHGHIADEIHAHKGRGMWDIMATATGARAQPMTFAITTAGVYDPESIGWELHSHAIKVLEQTLPDDEFFAMIFAADEGDDPYVQSTWEKANPNLGVSTYLDYLETQSRRAQTMPASQNTFFRLHLNVWTQQTTRWLDTAAWLRAPKRTANLESFRNRQVFLGLDLAEKLDMCALCIDIPDGETHHFFWKYYAPQALIERRAKEGKFTPNYGAWADAGWLTVIPGASIDHGFIKRDILELRKLLNIRQLAYDPWGGHQLMVELEAEGFSKDPEAKKEQLVEVRQGMRSMSEPCKTLEVLVVEGKLTHGDNPISTWMVGNAIVREDANGNIAPDKEHASGKIDGVVAAVVALSRSLLEKIKKPSVYETRGVRSL